MRQLRQLTNAGPANTKVHASNSPRLEYNLISPGKSSQSLIGWLRMWAERYLLQLCSIFLLLIWPAGLRAAEFVVTTNTVLELCTLDEARQALVTTDPFILALSEFDRAARLQTEEPVSREQFLKFVADEALAWTEADRLKLEKAAASAREKLMNYRVPLPRRVFLVKTTGREEANAAYCRGTNIVVLPRRLVNARPAELEEVLIHELFHLLSRNNPELRTRLYALIGFKPCTEIKFPAELESRRITNPDAPGLDFRLEVTRDDQNLSVVPVLFATPERWSKTKGGEFPAYLTWKLMVVERAGEGWRAARADGSPILLGQRDVKQFREQVGEAPGSVLQAEEILAEYLVRLLEDRGPVPPSVLDGMRSLLTP